MVVLVKHHWFLQLQTMLPRYASNDASYNQFHGSFNINTQQINGNFQYIVYIYFQYITRSHRRKIHYDYSMALSWAWWKDNDWSRCRNVLLHALFLQVRGSVQPVFTNFLNCSYKAQFLYFLFIYMNTKDAQQLALCLLIQ